jgi:para-aminobenzoate synthetase/4-amino-4-deoxychorismate lyase
VEPTVPKPLHARFDDLTADPPRHWRFEGPAASGQADTLDEVVGQLAAAELQASVHGRWVAVAVAFESAPAFDDHHRTKPAPPAGVPFLAWAAFERRVAAEPLPPPAPVGPMVVRRPNVVPYAAGVREVRARIGAGDVYQVNVTERFVGAEVDLDALYAQLLASQSAAYAARIDIGALRIACASPELFFRWDGDTITCRPMKGTRARHPRADVDTARAAELAASAKERAENVMIVDLLRNDLGRLARVGTVRVPELFSIERYETVWQMTSTVQAEVDPATSLAELFQALFPCGSVTGAPKIAAMRIIEELESEPRGVYCGAIGYLSPPGEGPRAVFCVPIRTAIVDRARRLTYGAGAGITWSSDPAEEDAEVDAKARVLTHPWPAFELLETMRLDERGVLHVQEHLDRLTESARWFGIPLDADAVRAALAKAEPPATPHRVRILVERSGGWRIECVPLGAAPDVVRLAIDTVVTRRDDVFCCHKTTARAHYAAALARHPTVDDVVLVNEHGHAIESTTANLAYRIGDRWFTPPLADGGLAGVGRRIALAAGRLTERSVAASDLGACDELAVVNDLRGWRTAHLG